MLIKFAIENGYAIIFWLYVTWQSILIIYNLVRKKNTAVKVAKVLNEVLENNPRIVFTKHERKILKETMPLMNDVLLLKVFFEFPSIKSLSDNNLVSDRVISLYELGKDCSPKIQEAIVWLLMLQTNIKCHEEYYHNKKIVVKEEVYKIPKTKVDLLHQLNALNGECSRLKISTDTFTEKGITFMYGLAVELNLCRTHEGKRLNWTPH